MEFELSLDPEAAGRLGRLSVITAGPASRSRPARHRVVWHDSPDRALADAGLALAEERGGWRLECLVPGQEDWPPGAPAPIMAQGADPTRLGIALPDALAPVAAFEGQVTNHQLATDHGLVAVRRHRGVLRTVTAERPAARLVLSGPDPAVLAAAKTLADALGGAVPHCGLAGEGLAAAQGAPPRPRRLGSPTLPGDGPIGDAFAHALGHLTDVILYHASHAADGRNEPDPVHQMRVAARRMRSLFAVFRPVIASAPTTTANDGLKELAHVLGPVRDWDVFTLETAPALCLALPDDARLKRLIAAAERRRTETHAALNAYLGSAAFRRCGVELAWLAGTRAWHETLSPDARQALDQPLSGFAAQVLQRRSKKLRSAGSDIAEMNVAALHGLRLRVKRMRYAAEILSPLFPRKAARRYIDRLATVQARLGVLNDGAVASELLAELGGAKGHHGYAVGLVSGFTAAHAVEMRPHALRAWDKFAHQSAFWA